MNPWGAEISFKQVGRDAEPVTKFYKAEQWCETNLGPRGELWDSIIIRNRAAAKANFDSYHILLKDKANETFILMLT